MGRTCTVGIMTVAIAAPSAAWAGDELPRYRLEPGMELSYQESSTFGHQNGMHINDQESTAWIARRNGDGSVRVVLRQGSRFTATSAIDTFKSLFKKQVKPPMEYHFGYFDLFPDGRLGPDAELGCRITPASLFPRLPDDDAKAKTGWSQRDEERKSYQEPMSKLKGHRPDKIVVHLSGQTGRGKPLTCPPTMTSTRPCGPECDRAGTNGEPPRPCRHVPSTSIMSVLEHR